jgi:hypothetical protein
MTVNDKFQLMQKEMAVAHFMILEGLWSAVKFQMVNETCRKVREYTRIFLVRRNVVNNIRTACSGRRRFKFWPEDLLSWLIYSANSSRSVREYVYQPLFRR